MLCYKPIMAGFSKNLFSRERERRRERERERERESVRERESSHIFWENFIEIP